MKTVKKLILLIVTVSTISGMLTVYALGSGTLAYGAATVGVNYMNVREGPGLSYKIIGETLEEGDIVVILECTNKEWYKINFQGRIGYVRVLLLRDVCTDERFYAQGRASGEWVNLRSNPEIPGKILGTYKKGTEMIVIGIVNGWYRVRLDDKEGYVRSDLMNIVSGYKPAAAAKAQAAASSKGQVMVADPDPNIDTELGQQIADYAVNFVGFPYIYGEAGPYAFDCSGFVEFVFKKFNFKVPRTAGDQNKSQIGNTFGNKNSLAPGDLVFFSKYENSTVTHVGIFIGNDEFVHASTPSAGVIISNIRSAYYTRVWHSGKRFDLTR